MVIFLPILNFFKFHVKGERSIRNPQFGAIVVVLKRFKKLKCDYEE